MALIFRDSFDFYSVTSDMTAGYWDVVSSSVSPNTFSRMGVGKSIKVNFNNAYVAFSKSFGKNSSTVFVAFATYVTGFVSSSGGRDHTYRFIDGGTIQCSVCFRVNGTIEVYRGDTTGTLLAQWDNAYAALVWTHFQIKVVIDNSAGEVRIRKNGNPNDDFAIVGVDTQSTSNAYVNSLALQAGQTAGDGADRYLDDFIIYDNTGSGPWNDWVGDVRAVQLMPQHDTAQKDFSAVASVTTVGGLNTGATTAQSANVQSFNEFIPTTGGFISTSVNVNLNANMTGHLILGIYDSDGANGGPGTLLASSSAVTNPVTGNNVFTLGTSPEVATGRSYYWGFLGDAAYTMRYDSTQANTFRNWSQAQTYSSGLVSPAAATSGTAGRTASIYANITPTNSGCVNNPVQNTSNYVSDSTPGDYDLYDVFDMTATPVAILGMSIRGFAAKSDAGIRVGTLTMKSGSTSQDGSDLVLATTFTNIVMIQDVDPDTGSAWTESGVNAVQIGPKVTA